MLACLVYSQKYITLFKSIEKKFFNEIIIFLLLACTYYASRRSRTRDTVKLTVCVCLCVCVSVPAVTAQRLQCDEN